MHRKVCSTSYTGRIRLPTSTGAAILFTTGVNAETAVRFDVSQCYSLLTYTVWPILPSQMQRSKMYNFAQGQLADRLPKQAALSSVSAQRDVVEDTILLHHRRTEVG
jgi:hypothetical protein